MRYLARGYVCNRACRESANLQSNPDAAASLLWSIQINGQLYSMRAFCFNNKEIEMIIGRNSKRENDAMTAGIPTFCHIFQGFAIKGKEYPSRNETYHSQ